MIDSVTLSRLGRDGAPEVHTVVVDMGSNPATFNYFLSGTNRLNFFVVSTFRKITGWGNVPKLCCLENLKAYIDQLLIDKLLQHCTAFGQSIVEKHIKN